jgi:hypothetical protein
LTDTFSPPKWHFFNTVAQHNLLEVDPALRFPSASAMITNVSCPGLYPGSPSGCPGDCDACPGPRSSTSYTDLHLLDDGSVLIIYDRLADGWAGPRNHKSDIGRHLNRTNITDAIFTMAAKVTNGS